MSQQAEQQRLAVIQGNLDQAEKLRLKNAETSKAVKQLKARERELARGYAQRAGNAKTGLVTNTPSGKHMDVEDLLPENKDKFFEEVTTKYLGDETSGRITSDQLKIDFLVVS